MSFFDQLRAIDTDTHITEPPDVWTSRVASKWGDAIPHIENVDGIDRWMVRDERIGAPGFTAMAGFDGSIPDHPQGFSEIPKSSFDAGERLKHMDREGIHAQVLYPNVGGFGAGGWMKLKEPELMNECVRAYNDFLVDWCSADRQRLVPVATLPFWDRDGCVEEIQRVAKIGHKAINFCGRPHEFGQPVLAHKHWHPLWAAAQDAGLSVSFHIGGGDLSDLMNDPAELGTRANFARVSSKLFVQNVDCIADLIFGGLCHKFPDLKFVSVESGVGWIQSYLEAADWQFVNGQVRKEHPEFDLMPSEYFRRQIYACFWFENDGIQTALEQFPDNILWETDFPHPTCQHPGPANGLAQHPRDYAEMALAKVPEPTLKKVLHDNAAALYGLN